MSIDKWICAVIVNPQLMNNNPAIFSESVSNSQSRCLSYCSNFSKFTNNNLDALSSSSTWASQGLMASISPKLQVSRIRVISKQFKNNLTNLFPDNSQVTISCLDSLDSFKMPVWRPKQSSSLTYDDLTRRTIRSGKKSLITDSHVQDRKGCSSSECIVKRKWIKNIVIYEKQNEMVQNLKKKVFNCPPSICKQIEKDITRSFPEGMLPKKKLKIRNMISKQGLLRCLQQVLKLYSIFDPQVGYTQGLNLVAAVIVMHCKDVDSAFIVMKDLMIYGRLRQLYIDDFRKLGLHLEELDRHLRNNMEDLYEHLLYVHTMVPMPVRFDNIDWAHGTPYPTKHIVINQYLKGGTQFLHRLLISLLTYLKQKLLVANQQTIFLLSSSSLKQQALPWDEIINVSQSVRL